MQEPAKIIAVWGSPNSGKTTFATKLATSIYDHYETSVIVLYTDLETPMLPVLFPHTKAEDLGSVGIPLSKVEIDSEEVLRNLITIKSRANLAFLGYRAGENKYTFPKYGKAKAQDLLDTLCNFCNYLIIDCVSNIEGNIMTQCAMERADQIIRLATPDLKSISYYLSTLPLYKDSPYHFDQHIQGLNVPHADVNMATDDAAAHLGMLSFILPHSNQVRSQMLQGNLFDATKDKKFEQLMAEIAREVVSYGQE